MKEGMRESRKLGNMVREEYIGNKVRKWKKELEKAGN